MTLVDTDTYTCQDPKLVRSHGKLGPHLDLCNGSCTILLGKTEMTLGDFHKSSNSMTRQNFTVKTLLLSNELMIDALLGKVLILEGCYSSSGGPHSMIDVLICDQVSFRSGFFASSSTTRFTPILFTFHS